MNDSRYADEGLGIYEGAYLYVYGAYRPSDTSIMRGDSNVDAFNAPSREQIYKRVMQLSEGPDWVYDYEAKAAGEMNLRDGNPCFVTRRVTGV